MRLVKGVWLYASIREYLFTLQKKTVLLGMANLISKYLNPQNDVAFKHVFKQEKNKDILISMLNAVLEGQLHTPPKTYNFSRRSKILM